MTDNCARDGGMTSRFMLNTTTNPDQSKEHKREREQSYSINEKSTGGGEPEGWRRTERRVVAGWEG